MRTAPLSLQATRLRSSAIRYGVPASTRPGYTSGYHSTPRRSSFISHPEQSTDSLVSPGELSRLIEQHAKQPPRPLTLTKLLSFAQPLTPDSVLQSVGYVLSEIPRMLAKRANALEALPFIVGMNPYIARTLQSNRRAFQFLVTHPPVRTLKENALLIENLADLVRNHADDIPAMAKGLRAWGRDEGVVDLTCSPKELIGVCGSFVKDLCEATLGASPQIIIDGDADATFAYVPVHLEYILTEILKNSFRASVEWHQRHHSYSSSSPIPPVVITVSSQPHPDNGPPRRGASASPVSSLRAAKPPSRFLFLRVRDQGGGVSPTNMSRIFSYSFTTAGRGAEDQGLHWEDEGMGGGPYAAQHMSGGGAIDGGGSESLFSEITGRGVQMGMGTIAGLGYGLPMSRLYAKYFGGSLDFKSLDGWGSDVYIKLRCLDDGGDIEI
uniref:Protein-serine/threonine kinase n=1 Tax=Ganoderma boninense TaxID=34458 RepID=A0A5K1JTT9_9APHY|nr:Protein-serine/threonine kinase (EC [Ganoderma boninense]